MAESIQAQLISADLVKSDDAVATVMALGALGDRYVITDIDLSAYVATDYPIAAVFSSDETQGYRIEAAGALTSLDATVPADLTGYYYIQFDRSLEENILEGSTVYLANMINRRSYEIAVQVTSDRMDLSPVACYIAVSGTASEYSSIWVASEQKASAVSSYSAVGLLTAQATYPPTRNAAYAGAALRRGTPVLLSNYGDNPYFVEEYSTGAVQFDEFLPPLLMAYASGAVYEYSTSRTDSYGPDNTGLTVAVSGIAHAHTIPSHSHTLTGHTTINYQSATTAVLAAAAGNDLISIKGVLYNLSSIATSTSIITFAERVYTDVLEDDPIYLHKLPNLTTVSTALWRHRGIAYLPPIVNDGLGVHKVVLNYSMTETSSALLTDTLYFVRLPSIPKVEDLGSHVYRVWIDDWQPGTEHEIYNTTANITDYFGVQTVDPALLETASGLTFTTPNRPGWKADS